MSRTVVIQSSGDVARKLCREIVAEIDPVYFSQEEIFNIHLAVEEAIINAVEHGNLSDPHKHVKVEYSVTCDEFRISITDEGCGFKPDEVPDPRSDRNLDRATGRGIVLMRACMDSVEYNAAGNCVHMVKRRSGAQGQA